MREVGAEEKNYDNHRKNAVNKTLNHRKSCG
jgi:hypothetical protein